MIKLVTGGLRIGVSARLTKQALADFAGRQVNEIEEVWHGLSPPYAELFAWLEGRGERPSSKVIGALPPGHALPRARRRRDQADHAGGLCRRVEVGRHPRPGGEREGRVAGSIRVPATMSRAPFPTSSTASTFEGAIDGELLVGREADAGFKVASFSDLQQRLNRKTVTAKHMDSFPAFIRAYDCLFDGGEDLRAQPFVRTARTAGGLVAGSRSRRHRPVAAPFLRERRGTRGAARGRRPSRRSRA